MSLNYCLWNLLTVPMGVSPGFSSFLLPPQSMHANKMGFTKLPFGVNKGLNMCSWCLTQWIGVQPSVGSESTTAAH